MTLTNRRQKRAQDNPIPEGMLPASLVATITGVPSSTLRRWAREGRVKAEKLGPKNWYIDPDDASRVAETLKPGPKPKTQE